MWHDWVDPSHPAVRAYDEWLSGLTRFNRLHEEGQIEELFEAAAAGRIVDPHDATTPIKPVREDPEVWELRHTAMRTRLRFYHAEPVDDGRSLVKLHRHIKSSGRDQQHQIVYAADRYRKCLTDENDTPYQPPG